MPNYFTILSFLKVKKELAENVCRYFLKQFLCVVTDERILDIEIIAIRIRIKIFWNITAKILLKFLKLLVQVVAYIES